MVLYYSDRLAHMAISKVRLGTGVKIRLVSVFRNDNSKSFGDNFDVTSAGVSWESNKVAQGIVKQDHQAGRQRREILCKH